VIVPGVVRALHTSRSRAGVVADLDGGGQLHADAAVVATGAFAAGSGLLPGALALRAKSEVYAMAELGGEQAHEMGGMPCVVRHISHPELADLYMLPPIRYPDGRVFLKAGANTMTDRWLDDASSVRDWYRDGDSDGPLPALRDVVTGMLPGVEVRSWHARRCADAYTAHGRPYIGVVEPGRLVVALGGNGRGAQAADVIGAMTAEVALTGDWPPGLPSDAFQPIPSTTGAWNGMTLLRDRSAPPGR
jgi:sarcosine oxidase